jgi:hypothetical protein
MSLRLGLIQQVLQGRLKDATRQWHSSLLSVWQWRAEASAGIYIPAAALLLLSVEP